MSNNKQEWCDRAVVMLREASDVIERLDQSGTEAAKAYLKVSGERNALLQPCKDLVTYLDKHPPMGESLWCVREIREAVARVTNPMGHHVPADDTEGGAL
jgi:hypothetical protein